ncbi:MAG: hypothetical protein KF900_09150 [Bacteroidetes bacterium]|nr:hypothetical protein [Bacteroidota bacterium]
MNELQFNKINNRSYVLIIDSFLNFAQVELSLYNPPHSEFLSDISVRITDTKDKDNVIYECLSMSKCSTGQLKYELKDIPLSKNLEYPITITVTDNNLIEIKQDLRPYLRYSTVALG